MVIDNKKDKELKEAGGNFLPFVGDAYESGISFDEKGNLVLGTVENPGKKVMVLGEYHYCDEELSEKEMHSFTRDVVEWYLDARRSGDSALWMNSFLKFERALCNKVTAAEDSIGIWNHLMFYNYLQVPLKGARMAGSQEEYENASKPFLKLLEMYRPDCVIVWGYRLYEWLPNGNGNKSDVLSGEQETWEYILADKRTKVLPVCHPSAGFSWKHWHKIVVEFLNR